LKEQIIGALTNWDKWCIRATTEHNILKKLKIRSKTRYYLQKRTCKDEVTYSFPSSDVVCSIEDTEVTGGTGSGNRIVWPHPSLLIK
jgi:hypothetical protein